MRPNSAADVGVGDLVGLRAWCPSMGRASWHFVIADILETPANTRGTVTNTLRRP